VAQHAATPAQIELGLAEQRKLRERKLGDILLTKQIVTAKELELAIIEQARMPMVRIGEALIALGFINNAQLDEALSQQREDRSVPLGELLVRRGLVSRADLQTALARKMGYPLVDVTQFAPEAEALGRLPYTVAIRLPALPLLLRGGRLIVAVEDPSRPEVLDDIEFAAQTKVVPVLARANLLPAAVGKAYERIGAATGASSEAAGPAEFDSEEAGKLLATLEQQQAQSQLLTDPVPVELGGAARAPAEDRADPPLPAEGPLDRGFAPGPQTGHPIGGEAGGHRLPEGLGLGQDPGVMNGIGAVANRFRQPSRADRQQQPLPTGAVLLQRRQVGQDPGGALEQLGAHKPQQRLLQPATFRGEGCADPGGEGVGGIDHPAEGIAAPAGPLQFRRHTDLRSRVRLPASDCPHCHLQTRLAAVGQGRGPAHHAHLQAPVASQQG